MPKWVYAKDVVQNDSLSIIDCELYPVEISAEEAAHGFQLAVIDHPTSGYSENATHTRVVLADLGDCLVAVKMRSPEGMIRYAIKDSHTWVSKEESAINLSDLISRFPGS